MTEQPPITDRLEDVDLKLEMQRSYLDYAMSVIVGRALPDVRDGLKPVHRRILYAMYNGGYRPDRQFSKCSRVVGDVIGQYHPHGDTAIYNALVRLAQGWSLRYPLVAGQGNFGSPGNDPAAAPRYTECRMAPLAMEMVRDIDERLEAAGERVFLTLLDSYPPSVIAPDELGKVPSEQGLLAGMLVAVGGNGAVGSHGLGADDIVKRRGKRGTSWAASARTT